MMGPAKITKEMLIEAVRKIREQEHIPCQHCVGPYDQGWVNCAFCMALVYVEKARLTRS